MPAISYQDFTSQILDLYRPPLRRPTTFFKMRTVLGEFGSLGLTSTEQITPSAIARWLQSPAASLRRPISNRSYLATMRAAVVIATKMGWVQVNPWTVRTDWIDWAAEEPDGSTRPRHLSLDDAGRLLDGADREADRGGWREHRLRALVYTYLYTGLRKSEALGLRTEDVDLARRSLTVRSHRRRRLKTRTSQRTLPLHPELSRVLSGWLPRCASVWLFPCSRADRPWLYGPKGAKALDQVQALATRAGIDRVTVQALRRTLATHSRRWGWGQLELQEQLGHGSIDTQLWYLEDDLADQRQAIDRIDYRRQPPPEAAA
jgi:integrase